jgi:hypothetical protein
MLHIPVVPLLFPSQLWAAVLVFMLGLLLIGVPTPNPAGEERASGFFYTITA